MNKSSMNDLNFRRIYLEYEVENKNIIKNILEDDNIKKLNEESNKEFKLKVLQNCNKLLADISYFSQQSRVSADFQISAIPIKGKEKELLVVTTAFEKCIKKFKDLETEKNNSIKNIHSTNNSYLVDCSQECKIKNFSEQRNCVKDCFEYYKLNSHISARLIRDQYLKYLSDLKSI